MQWSTENFVLLIRETDCIGPITEVCFEGSPWFECSTTEILNQVLDTVYRCVAVGQLEALRFKKIAELQNTIEDWCIS